jgi:hypothetical protein
MRHGRDGAAARPVVHSISIPEPKFDVSEGVDDDVRQLVHHQRFGWRRLSTGLQPVNPLVVLIRSQPGMAERLLAEHADDGSGRCRVCSAGALTGRYRFPCAIQRATPDAATPDPTTGGGR